MNPRAVLACLLVLTSSASVIAGPADTDAPKRFLSTPEIMRIVDESPTEYRIIIPIRGLKAVNSANTADRLFPLSVPPITYAWRIEKEDGSTEITEFPFGPEMKRLFDEAESYFVGKRFPQAIQSYQSIIDRFPDCPLAYAHLGDSYFQLKQYDRAIEYFDIALGLNPCDHRVFLYKADAFMELGRHAEAREAYIHSLSLQPRYWLALANLQHFADTLRVEVRTDLFQPKVIVQPEGNAVGVYVDDQQPVALWLSYALTKAVWLGEPSRREEMLGDSAYRWSVTEEAESLLNLVATYKRLKMDGMMQPDPGLDLLETIVDEGDLFSFIYYEIASRMCPYFTLTLTEEDRQSLREFIARYVVVSLPERPVDKKKQTITSKVAQAGRIDGSVREPRPTVFR